MHRKKKDAEKKLVSIWTKISILCHHQCFVSQSIRALLLVSGLSLRRHLNCIGLRTICRWLVAQQWAHSNSISTYHNRMQQNFTTNAQIASEFEMKFRKALSFYIYRSTCGLHFMHEHVLRSYRFVQMSGIIVAVACANRKWSTGTGVMNSVQFSSLHTCFGKCVARLTLCQTPNAILLNMRLRCAR